MRLMLLGAPVLAKELQAKRLMSLERDLPQISTGDMLRAAVRRKTEMGLAAKRYMDAGLSP